jgi:hypothetical protein
MTPVRASRVFATYYNRIWGMTARQDQQKLIAEFEELKKRLREAQESSHAEAGVDYIGFEDSFSRPHHNESFVELAPETSAHDPYARDPYALAEAAQPLRAERDIYEPHRQQVDEFSLMDLDLRQERQDDPKLSPAKRLGVPDAEELVAIRPSFAPQEDAPVAASPVDAGSRNWLPILSLIGLIAIVGLALAFRDDLSGRHSEAKAPAAAVEDEAALAAKEPDETSLSADEKSAADALITEQTATIDPSASPEEAKKTESAARTATAAPDAAPAGQVKDAPALAPAPAAPPAASTASKPALTQPPAPSDRFAPSKPAPSQAAQPPAEPSKPKVTAKPTEKPRQPQAAKPVKVISAPSEAKARPEHIAAPPIPDDPLPPPPPVASAQPSTGVDPLGFMKRTFNSVTGTVTSWGRDVIGRP